MSGPARQFVRASDGIELALYVHRSSPGGPAPTIFVVDRYHLMRTAVGEDGPAKRALTAWLAELCVSGFNVVFMDSRGSGSSGGACRDWFDERLVDDVEVALSWTRSAPWSDGWVAAAGRSWSGTAAMLAAASIDETFQAVFVEMFPLDLEQLVWPSGRFRHGFVNGWSSRVAALDSSGPEFGDGDPGDQRRRAEHIDNVDPAALALDRRACRDASFRLMTLVQRWAGTTPVFLLAGWLDAFVADVFTAFETKRSLAPWHLEVGPWSHLGMAGRVLARMQVDWMRRVQRHDVADDTVAVTRLTYGPPSPRSVQDVDPRTCQFTPLPRDRIAFDVGDSSAQDQRTVMGAHSSGRASRWHNAYGEPLIYQRFVDSPACHLYTTAPLPERVDIDGRPLLSLTVRADQAFTVFAYLLEVEESGRSNYLSEGQVTSGPTPQSIVHVGFPPVGATVRPGCSIAVALSATDTDNVYDPGGPFELLGGPPSSDYLELSVSSARGTKGAVSNSATSRRGIQCTSTVLPPGASLRRGRSSANVAR